MFGRETQVANKKPPGKDFISEVPRTTRPLHSAGYKPQTYIELKRTYLCRSCKAVCRKGTWAFHSTTSGTTCLPCAEKNGGRK